MKNDETKACEQLSMIGGPKIGNYQSIKLEKGEEVRRFGVKIDDGEIYAIFVRTSIHKSHTVGLESNRGKWYYTDVNNGETVVGFHGWTREYKQTAVTTIESLGLITMRKGKVSIRHMMGNLPSEEQIVIDNRRREIQRAENARRRAAREAELERRRMEAGYES